MPDYAWPDAEHRRLIGRPAARVDAPLKVSGQARYTSDVKRPEMLFGKILRCPHPHARVLSIDTTAAEKMRGVKAVHVIQNAGSTIYWAGDDLVAVAAVDEPTAEDAIRAIKIKYEKMSHLVSDAEPDHDQCPLSIDDINDLLDDGWPGPQVAEEIRRYGLSANVPPETLVTLKGIGIDKVVLSAIQAASVHPAIESTRSRYQKAPPQMQGEPEKAFGEADVVAEGLYGSSVITHCCLESHGSISEWTDHEHLLVHMSTQNVSGIAGQMAEPLNVPAANIRVRQDHVGGGFGSKFAPDRWGVAGAKLSKKSGGKPVRILLDRQEELKVAGSRASAYARVKVGAKKDGSLIAWQSQSWGTAGPSAGAMPPIPYVFDIPNRRTQHTAILNHIGPARPWRGSNHTQAAVITMCALDDLAAKLNRDPLDLFHKNIGLTGTRQQTYREELEIAARLMEWKEKWRPRPETAPTGVVRGVGFSIHTGGGRGHASNCDLTIHPDGSISIKMGTQDIGTGTRTIISAVAAETLGVPMNWIAVSVGDTAYPASGGSGGSSTPGGVSATTRRAAVDARDILFAKVALSLHARPEELESANGRIQVKSSPPRSLSWKEACSKLGAIPITVRGKNPDRNAGPDLGSSGVGGVTMAEVEVDSETGIVKVRKMVAVQDCGLILNPKLVESSCRGALIMGISYALYEEKIMDQSTGQMLNPNLQFYRLAGLNDIPELIVHLMTGDGYDERGVIGVGEPPVISPGAAISNAVANAIGVRVPFLPLTPDRVLGALKRTDAT
ncbi:MAG TPA: xanthine dehydrogenase family protein molybdopterin-binding subunit [Candidatus Acidoferrum sp.]|nr:xanthine dehydrogenase family protein molybdopterin-binding subunit [Candidatus Acidoferrum sp.]